MRCPWKQGLPSNSLELWIDRWYCEQTAFWTNWGPAFLKTQATFSKGTGVAVISQGTLLQSTFKMARTKLTARKGMNGAASRTIKTSKNIVMKAPHKPPTQKQKKKRKFRPGDCLLWERSINIRNPAEPLIRKTPFPATNIWNIKRY